MVGGGVSTAELRRRAREKRRYEFQLWGGRYDAVRAAVVVFFNLFLLFFSYLFSLLLEGGEHFSRFISAEALKSTFSLWTGRTGCIPTRSSWRFQK